MISRRPQSMINYLNDFITEFHYPDEAKDYLVKGYRQLLGDRTRSEIFTKLLKTYEADKNCDFGNLLEKIKELAEEADVHPYTGNLILLICLSKILKEYYKQENLDESIWFTSMCDLKYKLIECHEVHGIWGTFVPGWYAKFFQLGRFGFGKLQFDASAFGQHYKKDGVCLKPETFVINVHIPRTGGKLDPEAKRESYRQAAIFYRKWLGTDTIIFVCHSWLLFPRNREVLSPTSNLYSFIADYNIFDQGEYEDYSQVWRLFDVEYRGDVDALPKNTSLRRAYADWIRKGEKIGWGHGMYVWQD